MNTKRYFIVDYKDRNPTIIDLKNVDAILFNKASINFCIYGEPWTVFTEVNEVVIKKLIEDWTTIREKE